MTEGERDWHAPDGTWLGAVVRHPRLEGFWLAMFCSSLTTSDKPSGWYRYKTHQGAIKLVEKKIADNAKNPVGVSA